ncbi:MAG: hypothetical protein AAFZ15_28090 [Bacteroidota bacterium]
MVIINAKISKGLNQFRLNPFHVLQVPVSTITAEAIWEGEKLSSLARLGVGREKNQVIPWFALADELEINNVMQTIEEPLHRLLEQLFWFDFENDPEGDLLQEGLSNEDGKKLHEYLEKTKIERVFSQADDPGANLVSEAQEPSDEKTESLNNNEITGKNSKGKSFIAQAINSANLELLLGLSYFHGVGPMIEVTGGAEPNSEEQKELIWKKNGNISHVLNPHSLIAGVQEQLGKENKWQGLLASSFQKWSQILDHPDFEFYLREIIEHLDDDLLDASTTEVLCTSVPTRLADILVDELKELISQGQQKKTESLLQVVADSPFYKKGWKNAFHSLRQYYQTELSDLHKMINTQNNEVPSFRVYFKRLEAVKKRWTKIDAKGVFGLHQLIDESVMKAFNKIASLELTESNMEKVQDLLSRAVQVATAQSLKSKINNFQKKIKEYHEFSTCYFCSCRASDPNYPVVLKGRKETSREYNTVYYSIKHTVIPRCLRCAKMQNLISNFSVALSVCFFISLFIAWVASQELADNYNSYRYDDSWTWEWLFFGPLFLVIGVAHFSTLAAGDLIRFFTGVSIFKRLLSWIFINNNERKHYDIYSSKGYTELARERYDIKKIDIRMDALQQNMANPR